MQSDPPAAILPLVRVRQKRSEWLKELDEREPFFKEWLGSGVNDAWMRMRDCGEKVSVRVCSTCGKSELATGTLTNATRMLCGRMGCPVCSAEDRALRLGALPLFLRENKILMRETRDKADRERSRSERRARIMSARTGRRILADSKLKLGDIVVFADTAETFGLQVSYAISGPNRVSRNLGTMTEALKTLARVARMMRDECGAQPRKDYDPESIAWWIEPSDTTNSARLRMLIHGQTRDERWLKRKLRKISVKMELDWIEAITDTDADRWAAVFADACGAGAHPDSFLTSWFRGKPVLLTDPFFSSLWAMAAANAGVSTMSASGIVRRYYLPFTDDGFGRRHLHGECSYCRRDARFEERVYATRNYLGDCRLRGVKPFGVRALPVRDDDDPDPNDD